MNFFKKIIKIINPPPKVGGLEIADSELRFVSLKNGEIFTASVKLPAEILKEGQIQNADAFSEALLKLRMIITGGSGKKIYAAISVPDNNVYAQMFDIPLASEAGLEEIANLNLRMISPIDFEKAYCDWQAIDGGQTGVRMTMLGVFAQREYIDGILEHFKKAGFTPIAVEFFGYSLNRLANERGAGIEAGKPYLLIYIGSNGLSFNLVKGGNLYFNHFVSWQSVYKDNREVSFESFKNLIVEEVKRVLNFYSNHWDGQFENVVLASYGLTDEIIKALSQNFSFKIRQLSLGGFGDVSPVWFAALGSALRGFKEQSGKREFNLGGEKIKREFDKEEVARFARNWRNAIFISLAATLLIFVGAGLFLSDMARALGEELTGLENNRAFDFSELAKFQKQTREINEKIGKILQSRGEAFDWSLFMERVVGAAGPDIVLDKISVQSLEMPIVLWSRAANEEAALNFRKNLEQSGFFNVSLPIDKISSGPDGVSFMISFTIKD